MIVSWKVLRTSIAMSACLGLLAACQDRGQFHSKKWTNAELAKNLAAQQAKTATQANTDVASGGQKPGDSGVTGNPQQGFSKDDPAKQQPAPGTTDGGTKDPRSSQGQLLIERFQERNVFIEENNKMMQTIDPLAVKTFKGVTATVTPNGVLAIAMDVAVQMGKDLRYVAVAPSPISYLEADAKPIQLQATVKEGLDEDAKTIALNDQQLSIFAVCSDVKCSEVHVRINVDVGGNGKAVLAMALASQKGTYFVKDSNLKDQLVDFKTFSESNRPDANNKESQDKPDKLPTTLTGDDKGKDGAKGSDGGDNGGSSEVNKKADKGQQNTADADKSAAEKATADKAAAEKVKADNAAAAAKAAETETAKGVAAVIAPPSTSAQKSVVFNPSASTNAKQDSVPVLDMKPAARPLQVVQDPGQFKFDQQAPAKTPGIFADAKNLTGNAIDGKDKAPAASTDPKVQDQPEISPDAENPGP